MLVRSDTYKKTSIVQCVLAQAKGVQAGPDSLDRILQGSIYSRMWVNGEGGGTRRKTSEKSERSDGSACKMLHNLDSRMRALEGKTPTYFLPAGNVFVEKLIEGNKYYDDKKPPKGQAHSLGPRRTTLAGMFLCQLAKADIGSSKPSEQDMIKFFDTVAQATGNPTIAKQHELLQSLVAHYSTPKLLEPEIAQCLFFKTKKQEQYIFSIEFQPHSPLKHCYELVRIGLSAAGATMADGPPPRGPTIREIPKQ